MNYAFEDQTDKSKGQEGQSTTEELSCPQCDHVSEKGATFCVECGHGFFIPCPLCTHPNIVGADICEGCGEWLLEGVCKFCYAPSHEGDSFCGNCGNPPMGITCPQCQQLSHFDFCKNCDIPLTEQALEAIKNFQADPVLVTLMDSIGEVAASIEEIEEVPETDSTHQQYKAYLASIEESTPNPKELPNPSKIQFGKRSVPSVPPKPQPPQKKTSDPRLALK